MALFWPPIAQHLLVFLAGSLQWGIVEGATAPQEQAGGQVILIVVILSSFCHLGSFAFPGNPEL